MTACSTSALKRSAATTAPPEETPAKMPSSRAAWDALNTVRTPLKVSIQEAQERIIDRQAQRNTNINTNITADFKPHFMFKFGACKFDITSGKEVLENLNSAAPENPKPKIRIKYETIEKISAQYLNGMLGETIDDNPGVGLEVPGNTTYASRAGQAVNDALNTAMGGLNNLNPIQNITRPNNVYGSVFDVAFERAVNQLDNLAGGVSRIPENIFKNNVTAAKAETNNILKNARENIFGVRSGTTLGTALRAGSINSILPTINNISSQRQNLGNVNE